MNALSSLLHLLPACLIALAPACGGLEDREGGELDEGASALIGDVARRPSDHILDLLRAPPQAPVYSAATGEEKFCGFGCGGLYCAEELEMAERIVGLVNAERARAGLPGFAVNACLTILTHVHTVNQARQRTSAHVLDGKDVTTRLADHDIANSWRGENIQSQWAEANGAPAFDDTQYPESAMHFWMNSPPHRANILNPNFTLIGVAVSKAVEGTHGVYYATQVFMRP